VLKAKVAHREPPRGARPNGQMGRIRQGVRCQPPNVLMFRGLRQWLRGARFCVQDRGDELGTCAMREIGPSRQRDAQNESPAFVGMADSNNKGGRRVTT
jgi:hypothetical protein